MHVPEGAVLGRGSYGTVWRARDAHTGQIYAVPWVMEGGWEDPTVGGSDFGIPS